MGAVLGGLGANGVLMMIGAAGPLPVNLMSLLGGQNAIKGWYSGISSDSEDTMEFSVLTCVRSMNEVYPLERASEAYERMMSGKANFRAVLTTGI